METLDKNLKLNNSPNEISFWRGIGGHFDNITQILCEFIDNSISNIKINKSLLTHYSIILDIKENKDSFTITIEDSGTGIRDLESAFSLGGSVGQESPLNEHGFGLKHALASADPNNRNWTVMTRRSSDNGRSYIKVKSPYTITGQNYSIEDDWPGSTNTGTIISFESSKSLFRSVSNPSGRGSSAKNLEVLTKYLADDIGYVYSNLIMDGICTITIKSTDVDGKSSNPVSVKAIVPQWDSVIVGSKEQVDLGGGGLFISYKFGTIDENDDSSDLKSIYYRKNTRCSGLEIRINGRVLENNLISEIWDREIHPSLNDFLGIINLESNDKSSLPVTRTSKNGIREGDSKFEELKKWVLTKFSTDRLNKVKNILHSSEDDLKSEFVERRKRFYQSEGYADNEFQIEREFKVYTTMYEIDDKGSSDCPRADVYIKTDRNSVIYECKKDETSVKDVAQLRMYWDGCILDQKTINRAVLIGESHPGSVKKMVQKLNLCNDIDGNRYFFETKTWSDFDIHPNLKKKKSKTNTLTKK